MEIGKSCFFSLTDKSDSPSYARRLVKMGWKVISAGNTYKLLAAEGIEVLDLAKLVGGGEILGHKVLSLSRELYTCLLADTLKPEELAELVNNHLPFVDLVYCNFYPMEKAIAEASKMSNRAAAISLVVEKTDIGGPSMIRGGAKGFRIVVCRKQDMEPILQELEATGDVCQEKRQELRARAEFEVAMYVSASAVFHGAGRFEIFGGERIAEFKGENGPQSPAGLFTAGAEDPLALDKFKLIEGNSPSYNNWCDVDRLLQTMTHIAAGWSLNHEEVPPIALGVKHGNACGAAIGSSKSDTIRDMVCGDTRAIFGGLIMTNFGIDEELARDMASSMPNKRAMFDGVIAPYFEEGAVKILSRIKGKCRLLINPALDIKNSDSMLDECVRFQYVRGGILVQPAYKFILNFNHPDMKVYGSRNPRAEKDLLLAWGIGCTSNSNTITLVKNGMLIGNGVGQQDRVGAAELAVKRATDGKHRIAGAVAYSDSFFPFPDAVEILINAGVKTIFSTSGSVKDEVVQGLCLSRKVTLYQLCDADARGFFRH